MGVVMKTTRNWIILLLSLLITACGDATADPNTLRAQADQLQRQAQAVEAQATAQALATRDVQDMQARATMDSLSAQGTAHAMTVEATMRAGAAQATATAHAVDATRTAENIRSTAVAQAAMATATAHAINVTHTAESIRATASAESARATATIQAIQDAARATAIQATAHAVARANERERMTQPLRTFGPWILLVAGLLAFSWVVFQFIPIIQARIGAIHRDQRGDLPMIISSYTGGIGFFDPGRAWGPLTQVSSHGQVDQPLLTAPEMQDGTTKRAQFVDWRKGGRPQQPVLTARAPTAQQGGGRQPWTILSDDDRNGDRPEPSWPTRVPLRSLLGGSPSAHNLVLGVTIHDDGRPEVVRADMARLVHVAVGGSSGWGKSAFLCALAYQIIRSEDQVDLALIDLEGITFEAFGGCERLLWPVADTESDALAILQALTSEIDRRKAGGISGKNVHRPIVLIIDEATALLAETAIERELKTLALRARKYGIWCVLGGQDWKASSLDTAIRNQLASRIQFKALSAGQSRILLNQSGAEELDVPGRALAILPGRQLIKLQAPLVSQQDLYALPAGGPRAAIPAPRPDPAESARDDEVRAQVLHLHAAGESDTAVARHVFGHGNMHYIQKVRHIIQEGSNNGR
jgi:hypothetical protein